MNKTQGIITSFCFVRISLEPKKHFKIKEGSKDRVWIKSVTRFKKKKAILWSCQLRPLYQKKKFAGSCKVFFDSLSLPTFNSLSPPPRP